MAVGRSGGGGLPVAVDVPEAEGSPCGCGCLLVDQDVPEGCQDVRMSLSLRGSP